jgi:hypothetical protein
MVGSEMDMNQTYRSELRSGSHDACDKSAVHRQTLVPDIDVVWSVMGNQRPTWSG